MPKNRNPEHDIIIAARKVFQEKGYKGATMRDIAAEANINMAMLHYYFRSKDNLFYIIFDEAFRLLYEKIISIIATDDLDIFAKIRKVVKEYIAFFKSNPHLPPFIVGEVIRNPEKIEKRMRNIIAPTLSFKMFSDKLQQEYEKGNIRQISALSLVVNILSLCIFPAISKPVIREVFDLNDVTLDSLFESREEEIANFIIHAIKP